MDTNYNRIKVADLETNQPNKTLATNEKGELEFITITENISDPVSATVSGIVNNTLLQELGGVDKTINGVRIGMGNGAINTNTAIGRNSMYYNTTGTYNTAIGRQSLVGNTTGSSNTGVGYFAIGGNNTGSYNVAVGSSALGSNSSSGSFNTALGSGAGRSITLGQNNILVGFQAGRALTTGIKNLLIENTVNDGVRAGSRNIILNPAQNVTGVVDGNNNTIIGGVLTADVSDHIIIATGTGTIGLISDNTGLTRVPRQTNALIIGDTTGKAVVTKEYLTTSLPTMTTANTAPTSATATGVKGDIRIDADYMYICVATNTWKRSPLTTW